MKKTATKTATTGPVFKTFIPPLNKFQIALTYRGYDKTPSRFLKFVTRNINSFETITTMIIICFAFFALFYNPYLLLILPAIGAAVFYRTHLNFLWWKLKVFVLKRDYYTDRRKLYKQGTLFHHFAHKRAKKFKGGAIIWAQSPHLQQSKFNRLKAQDRLTRKEYILN